MKPTYLLLAALTASACTQPQALDTVDAEAPLASSSMPTWEEYFATAEPLAEGGYRVEGDLWFVDEGSVRNHYDEITGARADKAHVFTQYVDGTSSDPTMFWPPDKVVDIRYCVSSTFGSSQTAIVQTLRDATAAWESVANIDFKETAVGTCTPSNSDIDLAVMPMPQTCSGYSGCAYPPIHNWDTQVSDLPNMFHPEGGCGACNDPKFVAVNGPSLWLALHELGHALGFRHEHAWSSNNCYEWPTNFNFNYYTGYGGASLGVAFDTASIMHYTSCAGATNDGGLSVGDGQSARALYGMPVSWYVAAGVI